jgi:hypothetical protein
VVLKSLVTDKIQEEKKLKHKATPYLNIVREIHGWTSRSICYDYYGSSREEIEEGGDDASQESHQESGHQEGQGHEDPATHESHYKVLQGEH